MARARAIAIAPLAFAMFMSTPCLAGRVEGIVVESYVGERPHDAEHVLAPLRRALREEGHVVGIVALGSRIEKKLSRPGTSLDADTLAESIRLVDDGFDAWLRLDLKRALELLPVAILRFHLSPATLAQDQTRRDLLLRALVGLALAHKRAGHAEDASKVMGELIRSFPDRDVSRTLFGPEAHDLYRKVKGELSQRRRAELIVEVDDQNAVVFVNEHFVAVGSTRKSDLLPGHYRVFVQKGLVPGRLHEVVLTEGGRARLTLSWSFESTLRTGGDFVGFQFSSEAERAKNEAAHATFLARALGAQSVVTLTMSGSKERRVIAATVREAATGKPVRTASLPLATQPSAETLRGFGRYLAGLDPVPGFQADTGGGLAHDLRLSPVRPTDAEPRATRRFRTWKWIASVAGASLVSGGLALALRDDAAGLGATKVTGLGLLVSGAALTWTGIAMWALDAERSPGMVAPTENGVVVSFSGRF